jgi:hypothetical protein
VPEASLAQDIGVLCWANLIIDFNQLLRDGNP